MRADKPFSMKAIFGEAPAGWAEAMADELPFALNVDGAPVTWTREDASDNVFRFVSAPHGLVAEVTVRAMGATPAREVELCLTNRASAPASTPVSTPAWMRGAAGRC